MHDDADLRSPVPDEVGLSRSEAGMFEDQPVPAWTDLGPDEDRTPEPERFEEIVFVVTSSLTEPRAHTTLDGARAYARKLAADGLEVRLTAALMDNGVLRYRTLQYF